MVAIVERCHGCGTKRRSPDQKFCAKCGAELPAVPVPEPVPEGGLAWTYRIPVVNNRYTWIRWAWASLGMTLLIAVPLGSLLVFMFASGNGGAVFALKIYGVLAAVSCLTVIGFGLLSAAGVGNDVATRFALGPEGVIARMTRSEQESIQKASWLFSANAQTAQRNSQAAELLLPTGGDAKWKDVRRVQFDEPRHVISLRRRWHNPLRLYIPAERYGEVAAFVRAHVSAGAIAAGSRQAA